MKVEFDAEDSARLPADVPNDVFTGIGQKPQRNEGVDHAPLKSSFCWAEIVPLNRHHWRASGHGIVAILYANDEAAKILAAGFFIRPVMAKSIWRATSIDSLAVYRIRGRFGHSGRAGNSGKPGGRTGVEVSGTPDSASF
jgi:hypothetical protein